MKTNLIYICALIFSLLFVNAWSQTKEQEHHYFDAYAQIEAMLLGKKALDFKEAVFITENAYYENQLNKSWFDNNIKFYTEICKMIIASGNILYREKDVDRASAQCAVFMFMTDTIPFFVGEEMIKTLPFDYNFDDFAGQKDWSNMFVATLMETNMGNCHSLPFLYKMIMGELGHDCYLALSPQHIYIKAYNNRVGWHNIELTCGNFPTDAWYISSSYIHLDALRSGIYMDTLSLKQSVALCLIDLAQGYQAKFGTGNGQFILQCCETALAHFPNYINALLLKAETLTALYRQSELSFGEDKGRFAQLNELYAHIHRLGYRKMPQNMYLNWINSMGIQSTNYRMKSLFIDIN